MPGEIALVVGAFDPAARLAGFAAEHRDAGAVASFLGQVRCGDDVGCGDDVDDGQALELLHYEPLTLPSMIALGEEAQKRWKLSGLLILHRIGIMCAGEPIVLVACAARHRRPALTAVDFLMDHLKSRVWFWKREKTATGWQWIEPREQDRTDLARWAPAAHS
ncbi:molybdenum cofactor biosynthesis protein MoaE [Croceicoccus sp. F390]|uniref:Molybdopterin synthase catalytic subunit n=1 Tax=Croceicoccus esteveae TaxID=3075597 RepID=A0ABU2ZF65_9SPHN|nr:molybdenum cofactor biosynthesis protein MoaE [Croceicoccus sp. F390]MDT0575242.1 molybdenum cofactor biosynthesis protein MoaE [Croceicoccus sp. F390]